MSSAQLLVTLLLCSWKTPKSIVSPFPLITGLEHFISRHTITVACNESAHQWQLSFPFSFQVGASYNIFVTEEGVSQLHESILLHLYYFCLQRFQPEMVVEDNKIHIMWLLPQYTIVTIGEILFSITSLEFAYSQGDCSIVQKLSTM